MHTFRYSACIFASVFCSVAAKGQSSTLLPINDNFRALTQNDTRIFGLDFAGTIWSSDNGGTSFSQRYVIDEELNDTYYTIAALGDTVLTAGTDALMARSGDNGNSWNPSINADFVQGDVKAIAGRAALTSVDNQWVAVGNDGSQGVLFTSQNDGIDWMRYDSGTNFSDLDFSGAVWTGSAWLVCGLKSQIATGATNYPGVIYRSLDASTWTLIGDSFPAPLRAMATDGEGRVLAVGERGLILRSTDHGLTFEQIDQSSISEDLSAVVATGANKFTIGGDGKSVFESDAGVVSVIRPPASGATPVEALLLVGGDVLLGGEFLSSQRIVPFDLGVEAIGGGYRLTVDQALSGKVYTLETSTTLQSWDPVPSSDKAGDDGLLQWVLPSDGTRRFWRATEF